MKFPWTKKAAPVSRKIIRSNVVQPRDASILRTINGKMMRMFEAAISNNLNTDFPITISSANAEHFTSVMPVRSRARTLERDNPYAKSILETFQNNVGGDDPFRLEMNVGTWQDGKFVKDVELNRLIESEWKLAGMPENCTVRRDMSRMELDLQAVTAIIRDGGMLFRQWRDFPNNKYNYALQPLEIDRLDHYWNGKAPNGNEIKLSIEIDTWGAPVGYWLLTKHPGDIFNIGNLAQKYRERVAAEDLIVLSDIRTRAEQLVSMPRFASIIQRLHRIDQFDIAHVTAAIWASCKPFFITQDFPTAMDYVPDFIKKAIEANMASDQDGEGEGDKTSNVEPGTGEILAYGQKPVLVDPKFPIEAASGFKKDNLRAAAAGSGAAYHIIGQDLESVNFSSGRIGLEAFRDTCKILQRHFILGYRRPHFNSWLKAAILTNAIPVSLSRLEELQSAAKFYGRRWQYIQPLQDAQADAQRLANRTTSRDRIISESERGGDYEEVASELASDNEIDEEHELSPFTTEGQTQTAGDETEITEAPDGKVARNGHNRLAPVVS